MASPLYHYVSPITYRSKIAPNILARIQLPTSAINNRLLYHPYTIRDGDRPDTIAHLYYGDANYDWVVLLANQIIDMRAEWPLDETQFELAILAKYGDFAAANQTAFYEIDTTLPNLDSAGFNALPWYLKKYYSRAAEVAGDMVYGVTKMNLQLNSNSLSSLEAGESVYWTAVSFYEDEFRRNEAKRQIRLIDEQYLPQIEQSLRSISRNVIV